MLAPKNLINKNTVDSFVSMGKIIRPLLFVIKHILPRKIFSINSQTQEKFFDKQPYIKFATNRHAN